MAIRVGIDFGTSNSGVAVSDGSQVKVLPLDPRNIVPEVVKSILYITKDNQVYIGQEAVEMYYQQNINRARRYVKKWAGEIDFVGAEMHYVRDVYVYVDELKPGRLLQFIKTALRTADYNGTLIFDRYYTVAQIITAYLKELKHKAEEKLGEKIAGVTLGRPVQFFTDAELDKKAEDTLRQAALEAGFNNVDFEFEPAAAALYYERTLTRPQNVLVFDFGGGTLDITLMRLGDPQRREVYAFGGIDIAGSDFDRAIIEKRLLTFFGKGQVETNPNILEMVNSVSDWIAIPEMSTPMARAMLDKAIQQGMCPVKLRALRSLIFNDLAFSFYNRVEATKIDLSSRGAAVMELVDKDIDIWELYTRNQFESDIYPDYQKIKAVLLDTVRRSGLETGQIDAVVKTGGSSSIPIFTRLLTSTFEAQKVKETDLFSSVTAGLAIKASRRSS